MIGVGQEQRGDDAVGLLVARRLAETSGRSYAVVEHDGDGMDLMLVWEGADHVIVVDAIVSGERPPGEVARFDAHDSPLPTRLFAGHSTHALGVAEAIELARAMERLPTHVVVYGVEAEYFDSGSAPSEPVQAAVEPVARRVHDEFECAERGEAHA